MAEGNDLNLDYSRGRARALLDAIEYFERRREKGKMKYAMNISYLTSFALAACHADSVINGTIAIVRSRKSKLTKYDFVSHMMPLLPASTSCDADSISELHYCISLVALIKNKL